MPLHGPHPTLLYDPSQARPLLQHGHADGAESDGYVAVCVNALRFGPADQDAETGFR